MAEIAAGDYIKFEIKNDATGESEWMWLRVDYSDDAKTLVFGWLDSDRPDGIQRRAFPRSAHGSELRQRSRPQKVD